MTKRTITVSGNVYIASPEKLTTEQRTYMHRFVTEQEQRDQAIENNYDFDPDTMRSRAEIRIKIKCRDALRHNPNEGCYVYGADDEDIAKIERLFGSLNGLCTIHSPFRGSSSIIDGFRE